MDARIIALSIPFFFLLIGLEFAVLRKKADKRYILHDSISSLSCGVGQQMLGAFVHLLFPLIPYAFLYNNYRVTTLTPSVLTWTLLVLGVDLGYWAYHWASHRVNFLWAMHVVHHQSEEYNLTTALRQSWFTGLVSWVFYMPLALVGFPAEMFVVVYTLDIVYQFWIHTRAVGKLGPLEWIMNTPSHHRVHHGVDPQYIDKNYAGIFIIWDRLFGTFIKEEREPVYGIVGPLASWNPFWANVQPWVKLAQMSGATRRLRDKIWVWFAPPEWRPKDLGGPVTIPEVSRETQQKYRTPAPRIVNAYVVTGFILSSGATTALLEKSKSLHWVENLTIVALVMISLAVWSGLEEGRSWAVPLEVMKWIGAAALGAWFFRSHPYQLIGTVGVIAAAVGLTIWVLACRRPEAPRDDLTRPATT
ncbi:MAG: sterol desaturase family protein [Polyangiaceae bacterium]|nr:sterol desaturase family protein [Polyangiaceae bacterium]